MVLSLDFSALAWQLQRGQQSQSPTQIGPLSPSPVPVPSMLNINALSPPLNSLFPLVLLFLFYPFSGLKCLF